MTGLVSVERWHTWKPGCGETWEEFALIELGDVWQLHSPTGARINVCVTKVRTLEMRVAYAPISSRAGKC